MLLISAQNISYHTGIEELFDNISLNLTDSEKVAIVGDNGCGKTTFMRILNKKILPKNGEIIYRNDLVIGVVEQFVPEELLSLNVFEAVIATSPWQGIEAKPWLAEKLLTQMEFNETDFTKKVIELSGGWKNRLLLARALNTEPDFLLLDEPTNHMDIATLLFFEEFIANLNIPYLVISHDREFLDTCTNRTIFLRQGKFYDFPFSYSKAKNELLNMDENLRKQRTDEIKNIKRLEESANRLARWGKDFNNEDLSKKAECMRKRIRRLEKNLTWIPAPDLRKLEIDSQSIKAKYALVFNNAQIYTPDNRRLFAISSLFISRGDRIALLGHNGTGKSIFLKILAKLYEEQKNGIFKQDLRFNPQLTLGYYDQMLGEIPQNKNIFTIVREALVGSDLEVRRKLIGAGFNIDTHQKTTKELSGGQCARLQILLLSLKRPSILLLDEPTNHIDITGCEDLEKELINEEMTVFFSSHDRRFIKNVATRFFLIYNEELHEIYNVEQYYALEMQFEEKEHNRVNNLNDKTKEIKQNDIDSLLAELIIFEEKLAAELGQKIYKQNKEKISLYNQKIEEIKKKLNF